MWFVNLVYVDIEVIINDVTSCGDGERSKYKQNELCSAVGGDRILIKWVVDTKLKKRLGYGNEKEIGKAN